MSETCTEVRVFDEDGEARCSLPPGHKERRHVATDGRWWENYGPGEFDTTPTGPLPPPPPDKPLSEVVAELRNLLDKVDSEEWSLGEVHQTILTGADRVLAVAMRNALPRLLDAAERRNEMWNALASAGGSRCPHCDADFLDGTAILTSNPPKCENCRKVLAAPLEQHTRQELQQRLREAQRVGKLLAALVERMERSTGQTTAVEPPPYTPDREWLEAAAEARKQGWLP